MCERKREKIESESKRESQSESDRQREGKIVTEREKREISFLYFDVMNRLLTDGSVESTIGNGWEACLKKITIVAGYLQRRVFQSPDKT